MPVPGDICRVRPGFCRSYLPSKPVLFDRLKHTAARLTSSPTIVGGSRSIQTFSSLADYGGVLQMQGASTVAFVSPAQRGKTPSYSISLPKASG
jgi:hypothetical protein